MSVLIGVVVFLFSMNILPKSQRHSLDAIKMEVDELKHKLKFEHAALSEKYCLPMLNSTSFIAIKKRSLLIVDGSIASVALFSGSSDDIQICGES